MEVALTKPTHKCKSTKTNKPKTQITKAQFSPGFEVNDFLPDGLPTWLTYPANNAQKHYFMDQSSTL
ncbi:hypothetical protein STEG23_009544 [Scotinomys teguina]